jgi:hypothetical protein
VRLRVGNAWFAANAVEIATAFQPILDRAGRQYARLATMRFRGQLYAEGQILVAAACAQLERVLGVQNQDVVFHPTGTGGFEAVGGRTFEFSAEAEYPIPASQVVLTAYQESVSMSGGGPLRGILQPVNGDPIEQVIFEKTPYVATQQGQSVGLATWPAPSPPLWPAKLERSPEITRANPERVMDGFRNYPITWAYSFVSATPLTGGTPLPWVT